MEKKPIDEHRSSISRERRRPTQRRLSEIDREREIIRLAVQRMRQEKLSRRENISQTERKSLSQQSRR